MKLNGSSIEFEYRTELLAIHQALENFIQQNPRSENVEEAQGMLDLLGVLDMYW